MKLKVYNTNGQETGRDIELPKEIFGVEPNEHCVYLAVRQYLANQRQGTHKSKERSEISGSTRKLHKQKGTGGSRKGDINNPLFRGGGRVFGPRPRNYGFKLNKKVKAIARKSALSSKFSTGAIRIIEDFALDAPRTSALRDILRQQGVAGAKTMLVTADYDLNLVRSTNNLDKAWVRAARDLNTYDVLNATHLLIAEGAVNKIRETFA
ncbi:MAG: 50S ribosomal protein L4 [Saprospiraceae bacterium]|nr:50S ribosomal protein L4 [Saprospiraceae bacterium]